MPKGKVIGLGGAGDGIVETRDGKVFVPFVLPGETAEFELDETGKRGRAVRTESPSADRVAPVCPHFGTCGGCALQHMSEAAYRRFKLSALERALPAGAEPFERDDPVFVPARSRRRVSFALLWNGKLRLFGLNEAKSSRIVSVESCAQLVPELEKLILPLRKFLTEGDLPFGAKKGVGDVSVLQADNGADILFTLPFSPDLRWRQALSDFGAEVSAARISWRRSERESAEPLFVARTPVLNVCGFTLKPPAGCFLQPGREGEAALQAKVREYTGKAKKIADLFCGAGTFSLALLEKKRKIRGVDSASEALSALAAASEGRIETETRDLFRTPLFPDELDAYDAVVFDPPRAGAKAQAEQIALSSVPVVVAVSCNPATFARDAEILTRGGYVMKRLTPVDQFVYSPHIELVALFEK